MIIPKSVLFLYDWYLCWYLTYHPVQYDSPSASNTLVPSAPADACLVGQSCNGTKLDSVLSINHFTALIFTLFIRVFCLWCFYILSMLTKIKREDRSTYGLMLNSRRYSLIPKFPQGLDISVRYGFLNNVVQIDRQGLTKLSSTIWK